MMNGIDENVIPAMSRPSWHEVWMHVATTIASMSYDPRHKVGCVIVPFDNTSILSLGFNGNASGLPNKPDSDEPGQSGFVHAELNSLLKLDFTSTKQKTMYVTMSPCRACAKAIIQSNINRVVYLEAYRDISGLDLLRTRGIEVSSLDEELIKR